MWIGSVASTLVSLGIAICYSSNGYVTGTAAVGAATATTTQFSAQNLELSNSDSSTGGTHSQAPKDYANVDADANATATASTGSDNIVSNALIRKIVTILKKRATNAGGVAAPSLASASSTDPNKQLFGGRLPPFIERIVQRIQNYFSVYNPPEYFDNNRPSPSSATQHTGITLICSNSAEAGNNGAGESVSCNEMNASGEQQEQEQEQEQGETLEMCDGGGGGGGDATAESQDQYNVVVTHTIVQDSSLNVYSPSQPTATADSTQMVSNVVVILEPAAGQYSPPPLDNPNKNKFYVYVNPTSANNKDHHDHRLKTWNENVDDDDEEEEEHDDRDSAASDKAENSRPLTNTTYTVIIRGDKLQEYNDANNSSGLPEITIYIRNSTAKKSKKCKPRPSSSSSATTITALAASQVAELEVEDCEQNSNVSPLSSRSVNLNLSQSSTNQQNVESDDEDDNDDAKAQAKTTNAGGKDNQNSNKVPNINLMLVPPISNFDSQRQKSKNRSCTSNNNKNKNPQLEYYVLRPDNSNAVAAAAGSANRKSTKVDDEVKPMAKYYLQKTNIDASAISQTYLPPPLSLSSTQLDTQAQQKQQQQQKQQSTLSD